MEKELQTTIPKVYQPRRPQKTTYYQVVQNHLETWLSERLADDEVPRYIEQDYRKYLSCGILAYGFARVKCEDCKKEYLLAYSCKGRGTCPSCNTKHMAATAMHIVEEVIPEVPVRQFVLAVPKRIRYFLQHDTKLTNSVIKILLRVIEKYLKQVSPTAPDDSRFGGITFIQRFGSSLNTHVHFHCCIIDGVFSATEEGIGFHEATRMTTTLVNEMEEVIRKRVLRLFKRRGLLSEASVDDMLTWENSGFSLNASVRIGAKDRAGLERLIRYCARPVFASERLYWLEKDETLRYVLPKSIANGPTEMKLTPSELLDKLSQLIPPPRIHRHRYHGALAPNSPLRKQVTALAGKAMTQQPVVTPEVDPKPQSAEQEPESTTTKRKRSLWAMLLERIYEIFPLICMQCGGEMQIIAFITEKPAIQRILEHIGEPTEPPTIATARAPPDWDLCLDQTPEFDITMAEPIPDHEMDQSLSW